MFPPSPVNKYAWSRIGKTWISPSCGSGSIARLVSEGRFGSGCSFARPSASVAFLILSPKSGQMIAVANEVLHDRSLIALRGTIPPQPSLFEVGRVDDQRTADELACRKALERMRRPCPRMRTAVHPDDAVTFGGLCPDVNGYQALGMGIAFFPDPEVTHGAHLVRQNVRFT